MIPARPPQLFPSLCRRANLERAWETVLGHYTSSDCPEDLREFDAQRSSRLNDLAGLLTSGSFLPDAACLILRNKPGKNEQRRISLVKTEDRIVLTALHQILEPIFDRRFPSRSFAYRPKRGAKDAVERVDRALTAGCRHVALGDIDNFFDTIDRKRLLMFLRATIWETGILRLLETYLHIGVTVADEWQDTGMGIAQGSPLSPLLSNVYLIGFDRFLSGLGVEWVRYADNFILLAADESVLREAFEQAEAFLERELGLELNSDPGRYSSAGLGFVFLGWEFRGGQRSMAESKLEQKLAALEELITKHRPKPADLVDALREKVLGWRRYYSGTGTVGQMCQLEDRLFEVLKKWLAELRSGEGTPKRDVLRSMLMRLELPRDADSDRKRKWIERLLLETRPQRPQTPLSPEARRAVEARKREYREKRLDLEEILVTKPGTYLGRTGERLLVRRDGKKEAEVPLGVVRHITLLTPAVSISGELMQAAAARAISIDLLADDGRALVHIGAPESPLFHLTQAQARLASSLEGLVLARAIVAGKIRNQENLLRYFAKYKERRGAARYLPEMKQAIETMERFRAKALVAAVAPGETIETGRGRLFALEGQAAAAYWSAVKHLIWYGPGFEGRERKGARDLVNCLLNYGYGILYSRAMGALVRTGLNANIGMLHKPQPGKAALLYDFVEEFRAPAVDRVIFSLLNLGKGYQVADGALPVDVRREVAREVIRRLQTDTLYRGEKVPLQKVMERQAQSLLHHVEGKERYSCFVMPW